MKVLLRDVPNMMRDIIESAISSQADMELIDAHPGSATAIPDVAIIGTSDPASLAMPTTLLERWPRSRILMVGLREGHGVLYELRPRAIPLGDLSPAILISALRASG